MDKKRILIAEDEPIFAMELKMRLEKWDYQVLEIVSGGKEAISKTLEFYPDLILMDIYLDDETDGISAVHEIHKQKKIPVIYITASEDPETQNRICKTDYTAFITKPFSPANLQRAINKVFI